MVILVVFAVVEGGEHDGSGGEAGAGARQAVNFAARHEVVDAAEGSDYGLPGLASTRSFLTIWRYWVLPASLRRKNIAAPNEEHHDTPVESPQESEQTVKIVALRLCQIPNMLKRNQ